MKTRNFKNEACQLIYDLYRHNKDISVGSVLHGHFLHGFRGNPDPGEPTSLAHAAWAAGVDSRNDELKEAGFV